jgi:glutathione S-transferase
VYYQAFRVGALERDELRRDVEALKKQLAALELQLAKRRWL